MYKYKHMNIQSDHYCESQQRLLFRQRSTNHTTQWFETYMKVKYCTGAVVISLHCKPLHQIIAKPLPPSLGTELPRLGFM